MVTLGVGVKVGVDEGVGVALAVAVGVGDGPDEIDDTYALANVAMSTDPHPVTRSYPATAVKPVTPLELLFPEVTSRSPDAPAPIGAR